MKPQIILNKKQLDRLSEFLANISVVIIASVLTPLLSGSTISMVLFIMSFLLSSAFVIISLSIY